MFSQIQWIPACAGMTTLSSAGGMHLRGNDDIKIGCFTHFLSGQ
jgi:hypothetical protein